MQHVGAIRKRDSWQISGWL